MNHVTVDTMRKVVIRTQRLIKTSIKYIIDEIKIPVLNTVWFLYSIKFQMK